MSRRSAFPVTSAEQQAAQNLEASIVALETRKRAV